jgi:hypothetical protein
VRSFAVQLKHVAASNYYIWSPLTGDKLPEGLNDGNGRGPETKAGSFCSSSNPLPSATRPPLRSPPTTCCRFRKAVSPRACTSPSSASPRLRPLRSDGRVSAHEWNCPARQPREIRAIANGCRSMHSNEGESHE